MDAKKDALKFLLKRLANKTGATPEEIPMSISEPRLMEDLKRGLAPMLPGGPYQRGEASRLDIKFPIQIKPKTKEPSVIKKPVTEKSSDSKDIIQYRRDDQGNVQIITKDMVKLTPDGKPQRTKDGELIFKTSEKQKTKPKTTRSPEENRILQEKRLDKILENRLATIKRQRVESSDDVIDIPTGMSIEEARKKLADVPAEATSGKNIISQIGKLSPTTIGRSKAVDLKSAKAKKLVRLMNKLEEAELKGTDTEEITKIRKLLGLMPLIPRKDIEFTLEEKINRITNKEDRKALREIFKTKKIVKGEPVKVRPVSKKKRDTDTGKVTVTKGTTSRDPATGLDDESQLPNIVGQASDPNSPVIKLDVRANPGFPDKKEQEFFMDKVQDYLDQGDDLKTARKRAGNDLQEKKLSELTVDQLRDKMGRGSVDSPIEMDDIKPSRSIDYGQPRSDTEGLSTLITDKLGDIKGAEYKVNKKKAGGQVGKPKRKIKKSVRGNDLVAMMYD